MALPQKSTPKLKATLRAVIILILYTVDSKLIAGEIFNPAGYRKSSIQQLGFHFDNWVQNMSRTADWLARTDMLPLWVLRYFARQVATMEALHVRDTDHGLRQEIALLAKAVRNAV